MTWQAKGGALGHAGLRKDYWVHMQEARERLQRENPGASKREVLKMAVSEGDKKATSDSERCSWRELLHELEDSGMTDATVNSHDVKHATSSGEGGEAAYIFKPKPNAMVFAYNPLPSYKWSTVASAFTINDPCTQSLLS
ncbi:unnamed protein product [Durusdinium trenchii]|uniref:Uncharacterized protein n=1 Tax=Durusdinium trenchii TaxID=1381693 RepID=A0ABP0T198_9DINO